MSSRNRVKRDTLATRCLRSLCAARAVACAHSLSLLVPRQRNGLYLFFLYVVPGDKLPSPPPSLMTDFVLLLCSNHLRIRCVYGGRCAPAFGELWGLALIGRTELGLVVSGEYLNE